MPPKKNQTFLKDLYVISSGVAFNVDTKGTMFRVEVTSLPDGVYKDEEMLDAKDQKVPHHLNLMARTLEFSEKTITEFCVMVPQIKIELFMPVLDYPSKMTKQLATALEDAEEMATFAIKKAPHDLPFDADKSCYFLGFGTRRGMLDYVTDPTFSVSPMFIHESVSIAPTKIFKAKKYAVVASPDHKRFIVTAFINQEKRLGK